MAKTIKIDAIGELIDEKPYHLPWFSYDLGGGWGTKLSKNNRSKQNFGAVIQGINKDISVQKVMKLAENGDFDEIAGFYPAIFLFFGKKFINQVDFSDKNGRNRISRLIDTLKGPAHLKDKILAFVEQDFDFLEFLNACGRNDKLNFDLDSAISVYKLQGDKAIYPIICQIFYVNKGIKKLTVQLINDLPIDFPVKIDDFVSGCNFPVLVSPSVSRFKWDSNQNGSFLYAFYDDSWLCMDVVACGSMNLSNYALTNRINYFSAGGRCLPYVICWNWVEIIEAVRHFNGKGLIRDMRNTIFDHYWFNFGSDSLINVEFQNNLINYRSDYEVAVNLGYDLPTSKKQYITVQLDGKFVRYCDKNDVCFSKSEVYDWFELFQLL